jgi:hypothetical protein
MLTCLLWLIPPAAQAQAPAPVTGLSLTHLAAEAQPTGQVQVSALVSVVDENGQPVLGLTAADFSVSENNQPVPPDQLTLAGADDPLSIALLLDTSAAMGKPGSTGVRAIDAAKDAAIAFVESLKDGDQIAVYEFAGQAQARQPFTYDHNLAIDQGLLPLNAGNAPAACFTDALRQVVAELAAMPPEPRLIVAVTGQPENPANSGCPGASIDAVLDTAAEADAIIPIFTAAFGRNFNEVELARLGQRSGGRTVLTPDSTNLADILAGVSLQLRQQYRLSYSTRAAPGPARITVLENGSQQSGRGPVMIPAAIEPTPTPLPQFTISLSVEQAPAGALAVAVEIPPDVTITQTELFVNNAPIERRAAPPFDRFTLDINAIGSGKHAVRVEATADTGITASAEVELSLALPPTPPPSPTPPTTAEAVPPAAQGSSFFESMPLLTIVLALAGLLFMVVLLGLIAYFLFFRKKKPSAPAPMAPLPAAPPMVALSPGLARASPMVTLMDAGEPPPARPAAAKTAPALAGSARLVAVAGQPLLSQTEFELGQRPETRIGRNTAKDTANNIAIQDLEVSRAHAKIVFKNQQYFIEDLNSSTGTRINGQALIPGRPVALMPGAEIMVGPRVTFRLEVSASAPAKSDETLIDVDVNDMRNKYEGQDPRRTLYD